MENQIRNCIIARLIILVAGLILAVVTAGLFALGVFPLLPVIYPFLAALGAVILLAVFLSIVITRPYDCIRRCVLCLGIPTVIAALALIVLSLVAILAGIELLGELAALFVFLLALAFFIALIGFLQFTRCIAFREQA